MAWVTAYPGFETRSLARGQLAPHYTSCAFVTMDLFLVFHVTHLFPLGEALSNFYVGVSNSSVTEVVPNLNNYRICVSQRDSLLEGGETKSFPCVETGRYVIVQTRGQTHLTLCEVDVLGGRWQVVSFLKINPDVSIHRFDLRCVQIFP
jgi:hypothetical protein